RGSGRTGTPPRARPAARTRSGTWSTTGCSTASPPCVAPTGALARPADQLPAHTGNERRARRAPRRFTDRLRSSGKALVGDAELVAFGILHHGPAVRPVSDLVLTDDRSPQRRQTTDDRGVGIHQVHVHAVLRNLRLRNSFEVPGKLGAVRVAASDGGELRTAERVKR